MKEYKNKSMQYSYIQYIEMQNVHNTYKPIIKIDIYMHKQSLLEINKIQIKYHVF